MHVCVVVVFVYNQRQSVVADGEAFGQLALCLQISHLAWFKFACGDEETCLQLFYLIEAFVLVGIYGIELGFWELILELVYQFLNYRTKTFVREETNLP